MAHVFIVDDRTLDIHLKYNFAGTGAKDYSCDFLYDMNIKIPQAVERTLIGMTADISRIRSGDKILFYLQQKSLKHEGMFFGTFEAVGKPFIENYNEINKNYLYEELGKNLTFRVLLKPSDVYSEGVTERECLDSLEGINKPSEMCWSLIYRKLKGNRGCTMITDYEFNHIVKKIQQKNNNIKINSKGIWFDSDDVKIKPTEELYEYKGNPLPINLYPRLIYKKNKRNAYELHLQAYICQNLEKIKPILINKEMITWIGNEVSCGVGMQSIDIMFFQNDDTNINIILCELKDEQPTRYIESQIQKYLNWISEYMAPNYSKKVNIYPTIICPELNQKTKTNIIDKIVIKQGNEKNLIIHNLRCIDFKEQDNELVFTEV